MLGIGISDLFQWERFVTPTVIKVFYWLAVVISVLLGLAGAVSSLATMAYNPFVGMIFLIASLLSACMGVMPQWATRPKNSSALCPCAPAVASVV